MTLELSAEDVRRLIPLLESAIAEVDASAQPDSQIQPDDPMSLMSAYDWGHAFLFKLKLSAGVDTARAKPDDPHSTARVKCRICNYVCQSVFPTGTDTDHLECARCHRMTMEIED